MRKCDIIIPIYNAYDCLKSCIDSVIKNTNLDENRLILINDKSTDDRVLPLLKEYSNDESIILLENRENLGFVKTVNKGMKYSKENDVLLLNSDTEVTSNWLKKIKNCAYSSENIGTVTPLSNNATLASVPEPFVPNDIPQGYSLEQMSKLVEESSYNEPLEIPTGHGFCIFIKRDVLDVVGYFDDEAFGKGYGEENDFCFRCLDMGYKNVLCDNTYILHKESRSFKDDKKELIENGLRVIQDKYPEYKDRLDLWCSKKTVSYLGNNISLNLGAKNDKPNVLVVIHDWKDVKNHLGGTTLHAWDIISKLRSEFNFHVFAPEDGNFKVYSYWANNNAETEVKFPGVSQFSVLSFHNYEYKDLVKKIIDIFNINIIHVHHLIGHYFDLFDVAKEENIYSIITLHDYYTVCPRINKLYNNEVYCGKGEDSKCKSCLLGDYKDIKRSQNNIIAWRRLWKKYLKGANLLITPSEASKKEILMTYPELDIKVIEHGVDIPKSASSLKIDSDVIDIAFIGAIGIHKGSNILLDMIKSKQFKNIRIHLFGICNYKLPKSKGFVNHGKYKREELSSLLKENNIKIVCLLSTWPETFSYTLTESIACGVPVIAYDFGAIAERIKKYKLGWTIPINSSVSIIFDYINNIHKSPNQYASVIKSLNEYKYRNTKEMAGDYDKLYKKHNNYVKNKTDMVKLKELIKESQREYSVVSYSNYAWVFDTLKWKIISKIKIPRSIKSLYRKIRNK